MSPFNILALDGGGAKGIYTLGVLEELEAALDCPLYEHFDLVYGTSTGAIIATLLALGRSPTHIADLYLDWLPKVFATNNARVRSEKLRQLGAMEIGNDSFEDVQTGLGIVTTDCSNERPKIFKSHPEQSFSRKSSFETGFGVPILDALIASSAAVPFFEQVRVETKNQGTPVLMDGGFVANNPTLYAITDALGALKKNVADLRVLSVSTGSFSEPNLKFVDKSKRWFINGLFPANVLEKSLAANANSVDWLVSALFSELKKIRVHSAHPEHKIGMLTSCKETLKQGQVCGRDAFGSFERDIQALFENHD